MPSLRDSKRILDYFQEMLAFGFLSPYIRDCFDGHPIRGKDEIGKMKGKGADVH
jgi:hypothetical protein